MYLDSLGSLVVFLACAVGPALIAYLVIDDLRRNAIQRALPQPQPAAPAKVPPRGRSGWFAWSAS